MTMTIASDLHAKISAVAPILDVSIGRNNDPSTWRVDFDPSATDAQRLAANAVVAAFNPSALTAQDVKAECQRRIIALTGVTDLLNCLVKQMNMQMRAAEIINIKASGGVLTEQQVAEAAALQAIADRIKALRARSNEIEAINPIPSDFASDARWS